LRLAFAVVSSEIYLKNGLNFQNINHLSSIGLISFDNLAGYIHQNLPKKFVVFYDGTTVQVELPDGAGGNMALGKVILTNMGQELAPICGSKPVDGFVEYVKSRWKSQGYIV
jgi:hypothetical protein